MKRAGCRTAGENLLKQQLLQFGKTLRAPPSSSLFTSAFHPHTKQPIVSHYIRRVGRPSKEWVPEILKQAWCIFGGTLQVQNFNTSKDAWNNALFNHFGF